MTRLISDATTYETSSQLKQSPAEEFLDPEGLLKNMRYMKWPMPRSKKASD